MRTKGEGSLIHSCMIKLDCFDVNDPSSQRHPGQNRVNLPGEKNHNVLPSPVEFLAPFGRPDRGTRHRWKTALCWLSALVLGALQILGAEKRRGLPGGEGGELGGIQLGILPCLGGELRKGFFGLQVSGDFFPRHLG